jgi:hypothetical protein
MRFPPLYALARIGEAVSDLRNDETISHLEYWLAKYQEEYVHLMQYTGKLKKQFIEVNEEASETYGMDGYLPPEGIVVTLGARLTGINFFEAGSDLPAKENRVYTTAFSSAKTRHIWWELNMKHISVPNPIHFRITTHVYPPNHQRVTFHTDSKILPEWEWSYHVGSCGAGKIAVPEGVPIGIYQIQFWIGQEFVGCREIEIR